MSPTCRNVLRGLTLAAMFVILGGLFAAHVSGLFTQDSGSNALAEMENIRRRDEQLDAKRANLADRMEMRARVVSALIARRVTLFEAAAWFAHLESVGLTPAQYIERVGWYFQGASHEERLCRKVIAEVEATLEIDRHQSAVLVVRRLEAELQKKLQQSGSIQLPELSQRYQDVRPRAE